MAISLPFSVTMSSSVQTMQKLATRIAIDRMMNVAKLLELERAEQVLVDLAPVAHAEIGAADRRDDQRRDALGARSASSTLTSIALIFPAVAKYSCATSSIV